MLEKWGLSNFKSLKNIDINLGPLTVFAGTNSSGKSSVLQSILMIAQTLCNQTGSQKLVLNGKFIKAGSFKDIQSDAGKDIGFSFKYNSLDNYNNLYDSNIPNEFIGYKIMSDMETGKLHYDNILPVNENIYLTFIKQSLDKEFVFDPEYEENSDIQPEINRIPDLNDISCEISLNQSDKNIILRNLKLTCKHLNGNNSVISGEMSDSSPYVILDCSIDGVIKQEIEDNIDIKQIDAANIFHFIPEKLIYYYAKKNITDKEIEKTAENRINLFFDYLNQFKIIKTNIFLPEIINFLNKIFEGVIPELNNKDKKFDAVKDADKVKEIKQIIINNRKQFLEEVKKQISYELIKEEITPDILINTKDTLIKFARSVRYLGPLRYNDAFYRFSDLDDPKDVGISGEFTASVFDLYRDERIMYISPPEGNEFYNKPNIRIGKFYDALVSWLKYLGIAEDIRAEQAADRLRLEVKVSSDNEWRDLIRVGVGASQVIPILTAGLLAKLDSTLLFEQPEIHLHESVQTRLADFFISMILSGKQCLIETHTGFFIDAIRYRIAETESPGDKKLINDIKVYFAMKDKEGTILKQVEFNEYSGIYFWPDNFFDESIKIADKVINAVNKKIEKEEDV